MVSEIRDSWKMAPLTVALAAFLMVIPKGSVGQSVNQTEGTVTVPQGHPIALECKYKPSSQDYPFWYIQRPREPPNLFLKDLGRDGSEEGALRGFRAEHDKGQKTFHMRKPTSQLSDSAVYFCAVSGSGWKAVFGSGTALRVMPDIEDSEPSVYKLKPRKGDNENLSACLITDYSPGNILAGLNGSLESTSSSFVITSYGASYGTVVWDDKPGNFSCSASHKGKTYSDLTEDADGPPVEEFETDERLNFISITVLGLRVIFLKSVAINLLLTFRLWSC